MIFAGLDVRRRESGQKNEGVDAFTSDSVLSSPFIVLLFYLLKTRGMGFAPFGATQKRPPGDHLLHDLVGQNPFCLTGQALLTSVCA